MAAEPQLDLGLRLGEGTGAVLALVLFVLPWSFTTTWPVLLMQESQCNGGHFTLSTGAVLLAVSFFSRIPVPVSLPYSSERMNCSALFCSGWTPAPGDLRFGLRARDAAFLPTSACFDHGVELAIDRCLS